MLENRAIAINRCVNRNLTTCDNRILTTPEKVLSLR